MQKHTLNLGVIKVSKIDIYVFIFFLVIAYNFNLAHAQVEDEDFFEDEGYEEPYEGSGIEEVGPPIPGPPPATPFVPSESPPQRPNFRNNRAPNLPANNRFVRPNSSQPSGGGSPTLRASGEIEFKLVDPPKYWTPKKRRRASRRQ